MTDRICRENLFLRVVIREDNVLKLVIYLRGQVAKHLLRQLNERGMTRANERQYD